MIRILIFPFLLFSIISCKNESEIKPVEILYGQDSCERCKMIISEKTYSAEDILPDGETRKFDDIGCMIHFQNGEESKGDKILAQYAKDYNTGDWIDATKAYFVWSRDIITPMGHGIVALADMDSAKNLASSKGGMMLGHYDDAKKWVLTRQNQ